MPPSGASSSGTSARLASANPSCVWPRASAPRPTTTPTHRPPAVTRLTALQRCQMGLKYVVAEQGAPPTVGRRRDAERGQAIARIIRVEPEPGGRAKLVPDLAGDRVCPVAFWRVLKEDENLAQCVRIGRKLRCGELLPAPVSARIDPGVIHP